MTIQSHRDLHVWQKAMDLVIACYVLTSRFPDSERFGLVSQLRRSAVSVPANIAEGHGRASTKAYLHHLSIANGSLMELDTHLIIARRLEYGSGELLARPIALTQEVGRMLTGLRKSLEGRASNRSPQSQSPNS